MDLTMPNQGEFFEKLVTKKRLAELLQLGVSTIDKLMKEEGLPFKKIGRAVRFRVGEVAMWLKRRSYP